MHALEGTVHMLNHAYFCFQAWKIEVLESFLFLTFFETLSKPWHCGFVHVRKLRNDLYLLLP